MFSRQKGKPEPPRKAILEPLSAESLGLESLAGDADEDSGISLEELGEAYAALLAKGTDPYQEPEETGRTDAAEISEVLRGPNDSPGDNSAAADTALHEPAVRRIVEGDDDQGCEITPRS